MTAAAADVCDLDVRVIEGQAARELGVCQGCVAQAAVFVKANCIDAVVFGEEGEVVLTS
jgi:hypothetical protein